MYGTRHEGRGPIMDLGLLLGVKPLITISKLESFHIFKSRPSLSSHGAVTIHLILIPTGVLVVLHTVKRTNHTPLLGILRWLIRPSTAPRFARGSDQRFGSKKEKEREGERTQSVNLSRDSSCHTFGRKLAASSYLALF